MKKNFILVVFCLIISAMAFTQVPQKMSYQAVVRGSDNNLVVNQQVSMRVSILQGNVSGTVVYTETHSATTNANGLVSIEIGNGTGSDDFSAINWANGPYFVKTETDVNGGNDYDIIGVSQLLAVPYAMYAHTAGNVPDVSGFITSADIPAQVNADWNATSGVSQILNKPDFDVLVARVDSIAEAVGATGVTIPSSYIVTFDANGGNGEMMPQHFTPGVSQALFDFEYSNASAYFVGWNTSADGSGATYRNGQEISIWQNITLYAQWTANFTDSRDGNVYNAVSIGGMTWMAENLRYVGSIALGSTTSTTTKYRYYPNGVESNVPTYGYLYNWPAAMNGASSSSANPSGVQGICPNGWHLPSDAEWTQLTDYLSSHSEYQCDAAALKIGKSLASTNGWSSSTTACAVGNMPADNNNTGFGALPAGCYNASGATFENFGLDAPYWSATEYDSGSVFDRSIYYNNAYVNKTNYGKARAMGVRCVRD